VVAHGRPAGEALARAVAAAKAGRALAPVTVIVASNFAGLTARRLLGAGLVGGGIANVTFVTPFRLAELLAAAPRRAAAPHQPGPGLSGPAGPGPGSGSLRGRGRPPRHRAGPGRPLRRAQSRLACHPRGPGHGRGTAGAGSASTGRSPPTSPGSTARTTSPGPPPPLPTWPRPSPPRPRRLVPPRAHHPRPRRLRRGGAGGGAGHGHRGPHGVAAADAPVLDTCRRAGLELGPHRPSPVPPVGSHIVSVTDADEEVRAVVRRIAEHWPTRGVPLDRIGVFYPVPDPYVRALQQHLDQAGIPANGPPAGACSTARPGAPCSPPSACRAALAPGPGPGPRERGAGPPRGRPGPSHGLGRGVASGRHRPGPGGLAAQAGGPGALETLGAQLDRLDPGPSPRRANGLERELADVAALAGFVESLASGVQAVDRARSWADKAGAATALLGSSSACCPPPELARGRAGGRGARRGGARAAGRPRRARTGPAGRGVPPGPQAELDVARRSRPDASARASSTGRCRAPWGPISTPCSCSAWPRAPAPPPVATTPCCPTSVRALALDGELRLRAEAAARPAPLVPRRTRRRPAGPALPPAPAGRPAGRSPPAAVALAVAHRLGPGRPHRLSTGFADLGEPVVEIVASHVSGVRGAPVAGVPRRAGSRRRRRLRRRRRRRRRPPGAGRPGRASRRGGPAGPRRSPSGTATWPASPCPARPGARSCRPPGSSSGPPAGSGTCWPTCSASATATSPSASSSSARSIGARWSTPSSSASSTR
jgi:hypothetical protein